MSELSPALIWGVIVGAAACNFALRFLPVAIVSRLDLPAPVKRWLSFVPIAVMGSLVASEVLRPQGRWHDPVSSPSVWAAAVTMLVFRLTRSFLGASVAGMASFVVLRAILG